jgi:DNA-binding Xre family transcriptional regulator
MSAVSSDSAGKFTSSGAGFSVPLLAMEGSSSRETFTERINRLTRHLSDAELAVALGVSVTSARKIRSGETKSLKLEQALRLCEQLRISPWELGGRRRPPGL